MVHTVGSQEVSHPGIDHPCFTMVAASYAFGPHHYGTDNDLVHRKACAVPLILKVPLIFG